MKRLQKLFATALIFSALSASMLASEPQKNQREPPPKDPKVLDKEKKEPKEPKREERDRPKEDKRDKRPG